MTRSAFLFLIPDLDLDLDRKRRAQRPANVQRIKIKSRIKIKRPITITRFFALASAAALAQLPSTAAACAACMGDVNSKSAGAINNAIFLLLGFLGVALGMVVAFAITLIKRAAAPLPPHAEFSHHDSDPGADS